MNNLKLTPLKHVIPY